MTPQPDHYNDEFLRRNNFAQPSPKKVIGRASVAPQETKPEPPAPPVEDVLPPKQEEPVIPPADNPKEDSEAVTTPPSSEEEVIEPKDEIPVDATLSEEDPEAAVLTPSSEEREEPKDHRNKEIESTGSDTVEVSEDPKDEIPAPVSEEVKPAKKTRTTKAKTK